MDFERMQKYFLDAKYGLPKDATELFDRLRINLANHLLDYTPVLVVAILISSIFVKEAAKFLFCNIFAVVLGVAAVILPKHFNLDRNLTLACYAAAPLVAIGLFFFTDLLTAELYTFILGAVLAVAHAAFRPSQTGEKLQDKIEHAN